MAVKVDLTIKCVASSLNIRDKGNVNGAKTGKVLKQGQTMKVTQKSDAGWYYLADGSGWVSGGSDYVKVISNNDSSKTTNKTDPKKPSKTEDKLKSKTDVVGSAGIDKKILDMLYKSSTAGGGRNTLDASTRLFGGPHQFIKQTDFRINDGAFQLGRKYMESIVSESPIVYFMPGRPNYLPEMDADQRSAFTEFFAGKDTDNKSILDSITNNKDFRYYSFITDYANYMRYVNLLCRFCAIYIGIGDDIVPGSVSKKYKEYNWTQYRYQKSLTPKDAADQADFFNLSDLKTDLHEGLFGSLQYVQFFADPNLSFNESSTNSTADSKIANMFDTAQGMVKELSFMLDTGAISNNGEALQSFAGGIDMLQSEMKSNDNFFKRLLGMSSTVLSGSNMIFPQIWGDTAYNKSYNITINLMSPYGDKESIYLNCIVPMMHLLALSLPRQSTANSYTSPFLVRVFSKGWFSCEMGIVDNISIEKGGQGDWTVDGLPTSIKVSLSVKDMYSNLMITPNSRPGAFFQNTGLIDFLAVTCGVDITKPQTELVIDSILTTLTNSVVDIPRNTADKTIDAMRNKLMSLFRVY